MFNLTILRTNIKRLLRPSFSKLQLVSSLLNKTPFIIADVGSTGGLDKRWQPIESFTRVYSFDPDNRAIAEGLKTVLFPIGLWSSKAKKVLNLTKFPSASSLYLPNKPFLDNFLNYSCHDIVKQVEIELTSMEDTLKEIEPPDFIKVDAEGADLAILQGSESFLKSNCVGVQAEVQFVERNVGAPLFSQINSLLLSHGYFLLTLQREFWIRRNNLWFPGSQPQLIWADAIYLLSPQQALFRVKDTDAAVRELLCTKLVIASMVYHAHDYALELVRTFSEKRFISKKIAKDLESFIFANCKSGFSSILIRLSHLLIATLILIGTLPVKSHRNEAKSFFRISLARLFYTLYSIFSRTGEGNACVSDCIV